MFSGLTSGFKNIVNESLQELERLGELNAAQQHGGSSSASSYRELGALGGTARTQSESVLPTLGGPARQARGGGGFGLALPTEQNNGIAIGRPVSPLSNGYSTRDDGPSSGDRERRDSFEGFTSFGLSGLKRSLSGLPKTSLDLSGLRTPLDVSGRPGHAHGSSQSVDLTPSRDGRELGEWPLTLNTNLPSASISTSRAHLKRRASARSASMSGPYTPNTMMKMDPFFFVSLQGLPDELKQAAFTPLPTEDDDELLEQMDAEFSPSVSKQNPFTFPGPRTIDIPTARSGYPVASLSRSLPASSGSSFRPSSAPATGPSHSFFGSSPSIRSPLAEPTRLLSSVLDAHEEEQLDAAIAEGDEEVSEGGATMFSHDPAVSGSVLANADQTIKEGWSKVNVEEATPLPVFDDLPEVHREEPQPNPSQPEQMSHTAFESAIPPPSSLPAPSTSPNSHPEPNPDILASLQQATGTSATSDTNAGQRKDTSDHAHKSAAATSTMEVSAPPATTEPSSDPKLASRPSSPAPTAPASSTAPASPAPKHESLAARLARISRAATVKPGSSVSDAKTSNQPQSPRKGNETPLPGSPTTTQPAPANAPVAPPTELSETATEPSAELKVLRMQKAAVERLLERYTSLTSIADLSALEAFLKKQTTASSAASQQVEDSRKQLQAEKARTRNLEADLSEARAATGKAETKAKDEEEKKAKSITLLKAVRQKLIKSEKDREEAEIIRDAARNSEEQSNSDLRIAKQRFESETLALRSAQEQQLNKLRASFDREANSIRASYEQQAAARKGQYDLDILNIRSAATREITLRDSRINTLEGNLRDLRREKDALFQESQGRQAEVESATSEQNRLQAVHEELQYELKETRDRATALHDEVQSFKKARLDQTRDEGHTRRLLAELEASNADKMRAYEDRIRTLEKDRGEIEERMAKKLQEKLREVDVMRRELEKRVADDGEEVQRREERQQRVDRAEAQNRSLSERVTALEMLLNEAKEETAQVQEDHSTTRDLLADQGRRTDELERRNEELQSKEAQLRSSNKTLREELRKVQSGVLLSERSRNPGVGYFSSFSGSNAALDSKSPPATPSISGASRAGGMSEEVRSAANRSTDTLASSKDAKDAEEALNFEYIRNVILQFLEHKEMRPHLVSVLGVILQFTPAETRRLAARAAS